jgi:hypothetical protein
MIRRTIVACVLLVGVARVGAQDAPSLRGRVTDETGGALPGVSVELRQGIRPPQMVTTNASGDYTFDRVPTGRYQLTFALINFATLTRRDVVVETRPVRVDVVLHLSLNADVTVTGTRTFTNLADVENPAENLVGIAQSASQGAITAKQLDERPLMRDGEVLETVPGVIVTQHQRRRQSQSVLSSRLQSGSWDRLCDDGVGHAGQPAHARPRARLFGPEFSHS